MSNKPCGCHAIQRMDTEENGRYRIIYCPLHAAAPKLLAACEAAWTDYGRRSDISATSLEKMEAAIAAAKERK